MYMHIYIYIYIYIYIHVHSRIFVCVYIHVIYIYITTHIWGFGEYVGRVRGNSVLVWQGYMCVALVHVISACETYPTRLNASHVCLSQFVCACKNMY